MITNCNTATPRRQHRSSQCLRCTHSHSHPPARCFSLQSLPLNERAIIAHRAMLEIDRPNSVVNLGVGMPEVGGSEHLTWRGRRKESTLLTYYTSGSSLPCLAATLHRLPFVGASALFGRTLRGQRGVGSALPGPGTPGCASVAGNPAGHCAVLVELLNRLAHPSPNASAPAFKHLSTTPPAIATTPGLATVTTTVTRPRPHATPPKFLHCRAWLSWWQHTATRIPTRPRSPCRQR